MSDSLIFINDDAINPQDLFLNEDWKIVRNSEDQNDRIYHIFVENKRLNWIVKISDKSKHTEIESENYKKLVGVKGIPKILAYGISKKLNYLIMSRAEGIDLFEYCKNNGTFTEEKLKIISRKLLNILKSIHKKRVIHKDIKPENIIYEEKKNDVSIIDFEEKFTSDYQSPEQIKNKKLTYKTDSWSLGITLYFLYHGKLPFQNEKEILNDNIEFSNETSEEFRDFVNCLCDKNIHNRYSPEEALNHVWFDTD